MTGTTLASVCRYSLWNASLITAIALPPVYTLCALIWLGEARWNKKRREQNRNRGRDQRWISPSSPHLFTDTVTVTVTVHSIFAIPYSALLRLKKKGEGEGDGKPICICLWGQPPITSTYCTCSQCATWVRCLLAKTRLGSFYSFTILPRNGVNHYTPHHTTPTTRVSIRY